MRRRTKALLLSFSAVLLVAASVLGTMAYLTDKDSVVNTFTVGHVAIKLDEAKVNDNGDPVKKDGDGYTKVDNPDDAERVKENDYHLLPGHTYTKDPTVTVVKGSETSYIKMTVTVSYASQLDEIFDELNKGKGDNEKIGVADVLTGFDSTKWTYKGNTKDTTANTRTYEFWYKESVDASNADVKLPALFTTIKVPGEVTGKQLATLVTVDDDGKVTDQLKITANAYAIQADGFNTAAAAWEKFTTD